MMSPNPRQSVWLPLQQLRPDAEFRLICFPHAGAGANIFHSWSNAYGPRTSVCAVELPGRWSRHREPALKNLLQLVDAAMVGLEHVLHGRFALFGYSYGALVAFELARALRRRGAAAPEHLFIAARSAPQLGMRNSPIHALPDAGFLQEMDRRYGGIPDAIRREPDLLALVLPVMRADLTAVETYRYSPEPPLDIPITVFGGKDDRGLTTETAEAWREQTTSGFEFHILPGDHFVLNRSGAAVQQIIQRAIHTAA